MLCAINHMLLMLQAMFKMLMGHYIGTPTSLKIGASIGPVSGSRGMARLPATGDDCMGTGHKNNILTMDDRQL